jgi:hypothetical protein
VDSEKKKSTAELKHRPEREYTEAEKKKYGRNFASLLLGIEI